MVRPSRPLPASAAPILATLLGVVSAWMLGAAPAAAQPSYLLFESGPVRPVALSPNGQKLFVTNIPDGTLEIFDVAPSTGMLLSVASVPVGLEPVAVAPRNDDEVWVVNHLSDSVSIVDVSSSPPRVVRTLLVGDEPRDIVFAGSPQRAFISTAHRGQHRTDGSISGVTGAGDPQLTSEGIGRADVWVFDPASPGSALGGVPVEILSFFADTPRALATDGTTVWVAAFHSGNQTTAIPETTVPNTQPNAAPPTTGAGFPTACGGGGQGVGVPAPGTNFQGVEARETGLIVKWNGADWMDAIGCTWNSAVQLSLPDHDVFEVSVTPGTGALVVGDVFDHVGTILFNMVHNPVTGKLYVTNTESPNHVRFEGPGNEGTGAFLGSTVQGHLSESRVTVIDPTSPATPADPQHLNSHLDYGLLHTTSGVSHATIDAQVTHSLATPLQAVVTGDLGGGLQRVYIAAFGSSKIGVLEATDLEAGSFDPTVESANYISVGGGPSGLALNGADDRLYVLTRFDNSVSVIDVGGGGTGTIQTVRLPSPEPASIVDGRPILYDAATTSGNGEASCSSCHIFGDFDSLAWNLGDPDSAVTTDTQPMATPFFDLPFPGNEQDGNIVDDPNFHPMKGPMTTQTLRGMATHGGMHWRGDRVDGFFSPGGTSCGGSSFSNAPCDEETSFKNFIVAFEGLIGHEGLIPEADMQAFSDFTLQLMLPPNPVQSLDNVLPNADLAPGGDGNPTAGHAVYFSCGGDEDTHVECSFPQLDPDATDTVEDCDGCHDLDPASGFFGTGGEKTFEGEPQNVKVAHLRNAYQKLGMFGLVGENPNTGPQVRGFGFLHDGAVDTLFDFVNGAPFTITAGEARDLEQFMLRFPSDLAPAVGQQVSIGPGSPGSFASGAVNARVGLIDGRGGAAFDSFVLGGTVTECDAVVKTVEGGAPRSYLRLPGGSYESDDGVANAISEATLRAKADPGGAGQDLHYLCAAPGSGVRVALDRDEDGVQNGVDNCSAWPNGASLGTCTAGDANQGGACTSAVDCGTGGFCSQAQEDGDGDGTGDACEPVLLPEPGAIGGLVLGALVLVALRRRRS